eukprot:351879-Chlamydomonas_euryale.AAC.6
MPVLRACSRVSHAQACSDPCMHSTPLPLPSPTRCPQCRGHTQAVLPFLITTPLPAPYCVLRAPQRHEQPPTTAISHPPRRHPHGGTHAPGQPRPTTA